MGFLETVFLKILSMSVTASYVIAAIWIVRLLLKKVPKVYAYALWSAAAFRLVCPVSFTSGLSIFNVTALFSAQNAAGTSISSSADANLAAMPISSAPLSGIQSGASLTAYAGGMGILIGAAVFVWCVGIFAMLAYSVFSYLKVRRAVGCAVRLEGNVYECETVASPFVLGIIKPKIHIPFRMSDTEKACILSHERHHIRRFDHVIKPLAFLILSVYWFHPLVWLAYTCMIRDMEMSCDEQALLLTGSKRDYSLSLLSVGTHRRFLAAGPLFFGESAVKARVQNVLGYKKPKAWLMALTLLLCLAAVVACSADKPAEQSAAADVDINGMYAFEENVYTNPLSSFFAAKGYMPYYNITDDKLIIADQLNDTLEEYAGEPAPAAVGEEDFKALFEDDIVFVDTEPDISVYSQCRQYAVYWDEEKHVEFRVYLMDNEVWLARFTNGHMWSIYRLIKTDDVSVGIIGGADGPTNVYVNRADAA